MGSAVPSRVSLLISIFRPDLVQRAGGRGALADFFFFFFPCPADHEQREGPQCKVDFFGLATNTLNVRNNNNNNN